MHLEPVLVPLPIEQVNHLGRTGQALVHPEAYIEAFEEVGVDKGGQPVLPTDLLVRVEAEVDSPLQGSPIQGSKCGEILNKNTSLSFCCWCLIKYQISMLLCFTHTTHEQDR